MSETKIDRIPSQRNDADRVAIAMIERSDSSKLIVRAFRWQGEWYDVRKKGDWKIVQLDMAKTKLFNTVEEARAAAGISYLSDPPGKRLRDVFGMSMEIDIKINMSKTKESDLCKTPKYPADAVYEFVKDNEFRIYYYEDIEPKQSQTVLDATVKVEAAANALQDAATALKSTNQTSIVPPPTSPRPVNGAIMSPTQLHEAIEREYATKLRDRINEKLIEASKEKQKHLQSKGWAPSTILVTLYEPCIPDMYPKTPDQEQIFDRVVDEYRATGWSLVCSFIEEKRKTPNTQSIHRSVRLEFNPAESQSK